jgi:hypothetical protein
VLCSNWCSRFYDVYSMIYVSSSHITTAVAWIEDSVCLMMSSYSRCTYMYLGSMTYAFGDKLYWLFHSAGTSQDHRHFWNRCTCRVHTALLSYLWALYRSSDILRILR